jgi:hypothetical protein
VDRLVPSPRLPGPQPIPRGPRQPARPLRRRGHPGDGGLRLNAVPDPGPAARSHRGPPPT